MIKHLDICIDFDGSAVTHEFPFIGKDIGAVPVLKRLVAAGHRLILFTMRSNLKDTEFTKLYKDLPEDKRPKSPNFLDDAVKWFSDNDIPLFGINTNPEQKSWTDSPKAYSQLYIDDAAHGAKLKTDKALSDRPFLDWPQIERDLELCGVLPLPAFYVIRIHMPTQGREYLQDTTNGWVSTLKIEEAKRFHTELEAFTVASNCESIGYVQIDRIIDTGNK